MDHAFLRAQPAQLAVTDRETVPERAHVGGDLFQGLANDQRCQRLHGGCADLVATADGEGQAVAFQVRGVGVQHDVGGRVVRCAVHGVGAVQRQRSREADVADAQVGNA
ncbi:hypothetical protein D3C80_1612280 [compost metagenome]